MKIHVLYKTLLREAEKLPSYNFRSYAIRRIRSAFNENKCLTNPEKIQEEIKFALENLNIIKRQVVIGNLYTAEKLVIERKTT